MKLNLVPARTGVLWVRSGLKAFARQPLAFISLFFFFMAAVSIASQLPLVGAAIALMLLPTMTLGLMAAAQQAAGPEKPAAGTVFLAALNAVRADVRPMAVLGALYAGLFLGVMAISALADGGQFARVYLLGGPLTRELAESTEFQVALWIAMGLYLPLSLAFWHAPALVHWHRVPPAKSLFFSFVACFKNFGALTVFGLEPRRLLFESLAQLAAGAAIPAPESAPASPAQPEPHRARRRLFKRLFMFWQR